MDVFWIAESIGIASSALSGYFFAVRKNCDWLGILVAAALTALGGGLMRDAIVSRPPYSFTHYSPGLIVIGVIVIAIMFKLHRREDMEHKFIFITSDAFGLVSFSIVGAIVGIEFGYNIFGILALALCTGVGGGAMRDILLNEVPWFLRTGLYATVSIVIGLMYYGLHAAGLTGIFWVMTLFVFGVVFRLLAYYKGWHLPTLEGK